jgi:hypothetical protein
MKPAGRPVMTMNEREPHRNNTGPTGSLERMHFSDEMAGEKSLLRLVQERVAAHDRDSDMPGATSAAMLDEIDRDEPIDLENMMIRLGGNGF